MTTDKIAEIRARHETDDRWRLTSSMIRARHADRATLLAEVERLRAVLQNIAEELEGEEPRSHKKIALSIREALEAKP